MGTAREIIQRSAWRVGASSAGEIIGRAVNVSLPFAIIAVHGVNELTDSFFLAMALALFVHGTLANVLITALVPEFVKDTEKRNLRSFILLSAITSILIALIAALLTARELPANTSFINSIAAGLMAAVGLITAPAVAALHSDHRYALSGLTWGLRVVPVAIYLIVWPEKPILHWLLAGLALADTVRMAILLQASQKRLCLRKTAASLDFLLATKHLIIAAVINGFTPLLVRCIISIGSPGNLSLFEAADRIYSITASPAVIGIGNVTLVYLARLTGTNQERSGWHMILWTSAAWSLFWLALSILLWASFPMVAHWLGLSGESAVTVVRETYLALILGLPGFIMIGAFSRKLIITENSSSLIPMAIFALGCSTLGGGLLFIFFGTTGIAIALSLSQYSVALMMFYRLQRISA